MTAVNKHLSVRLDPNIADLATTAARVRGQSVNALINDALAHEIERLVADPDFQAAADKILNKDRAILDQLAGR